MATVSARLRVWLDATSKVAAVASARLILLAEDCMAAWQWVAILPVRAGLSCCGDENGMAWVRRRTMVVEACGFEKDDDNEQRLVAVQAELRWSYWVGVYGCA